MDCRRTEVKVMPEVCVVVDMLSSVSRDASREVRAVSSLPVRDKLSRKI